MTDRRPPSAAAIGFLVAALALFGQLFGGGAVPIVASVASSPGLGVLCHSGPANDDRKSDDRGRQADHCPLCVAAISAAAILPPTQAASAPPVMSWIRVSFQAPVQAEAASTPNAAYPRGPPTLS